MHVIYFSQGFMMFLQL